MPLREFGCTSCGKVIEKFFWHTQEHENTVVLCDCDMPMSLLWSVPQLDTSSTFRPFVYTGPTGLKHEINNLHNLRQVEHLYEHTGHNIRFDAYSANQNNPDDIDGFGPEYWDGNPSHTSGKVYALPTQ